MANGLNIRMLGDIEITYGNASLLPKLSSKSIAIISLLICHENRKMTREKIASMLWADSFETANYNLRYNLWNLKKVVPQYHDEDFILSTKESCCINPNYRFRSDVTGLEHINVHVMERMSVDSLKPIKSQLKGEFMDQFYIKDSEEFNDWTLLLRAKYQKLYTQCLNILLEKYAEQNQLDDAIEVLEEMLLVNPYDEDTHFRLMEMHVKKGSRHLAILQYKKCNALLREELNIVPQKKIKDLYFSIIDSGEEDRGAGREESMKKSFVFTLNEYADGQLEYWVMSELIDKIFHTLDQSSLDEIPKWYWPDICSIYPNAVEYCDGDSGRPDPKDIRLFYSLRSILKHLMNEFRMEILIKNSGNMDEKSRHFFSMIENSMKIHIRYIKE